MELPTPETMELAAAQADDALLDQMETALTDTQTALDEWRHAQALAVQGWESNGSRGRSKAEVAYLHHKPSTRT